MNSRDKRYYSLAEKASSFSDYKKCHIGCIAVYKNKVIAAGYNTNKTSPLQAEYNKYRGYILPPQKNGIHAEMSCLIKIKDMDIDQPKLETETIIDSKGDIQSPEELKDKMSNY